MIEQNDKDRIIAEAERIIRRSMARRVLHISKRSNTRFDWGPEIDTLKRGLARKNSEIRYHTFIHLISLIVIITLMFTLTR